MNRRRVALLLILVVIGGITAGCKKEKDKKLEVESVQIVNVRGKAKRFGAFTGRRRNWKKAYVCLKKGQEITFAQEA